ncbi:MAG: hypothetical protein MUC29_07555 [Pyrinomonadaceae bacterium]|nr:hypothetical protein [Pyrinomonadaceae bacterium]
MKKTFLILIATFLFSVNIVLAQRPADFDQGFGSTNSGITYESQVYSNSIVKDLNNEIVTTSDSSIRKYDRSGRLLRSKTVYRPLSGGTITETYFSRVKVLPTNEYIVSGGNFVSPNYGICMAKLDANLDLVTSFGQAGISCIAFKYDVWVADMTLQNDGKIVIVGYMYENHNVSSTWSQFTARFDNFGNVDASFGRRGIVYEKFQNDETQGHSVAMLDDSIVVGGMNRTPSYHHIVVYDKNGKRQTKFNNGNVLFGYGYRIAVQPDYKIVAFNYQTSYTLPAVFARFTYDGNLDPTFGIGGISNIYTSDNTVISSIDFDVNKDIIVAGMQQIPGTFTTKPFIARYKPSGDLDSNFTTSYAQTLPLGANILDFSILGGNSAKISGIFTDGTQIIGVTSISLNLSWNGSALFKLNG